MYKAEKLSKLKKIIMEKEKNSNMVTAIILPTHFLVNKKQRPLSFAVPILNISTFNTDTGVIITVMPSHSKCAISNLGKTEHVSAYYKILKVRSHKTVKILLFLSSYIVLLAAFFFNMHVIS